jgi:riboflavin synthase
VETSAGATRLVLDLGPLAGGVRRGDSVAINGCCLTATEITATQITFDLLEETGARTNLRSLRPGARVNIERAMPAGGRYGGHFVTGHIDAAGAIRAWGQVGADYELRIGIAREQGAYLVPKGCIAIDGISLTVAEVSPEEFSVWIIPHTREVTALQERKIGDLVNLEFDLLAKYTEKILAVRGSVPPAAG